VPGSVSGGLAGEAFALAMVTEAAFGRVDGGLVRREVFVDPVIHGFGFEYSKISASASARCSVVTYSTVTGQTTAGSTFRNTKLTLLTLR